jgi:hypothetical protein
MPIGIGATGKAFRARLFNRLKAKTSSGEVPPPPVARTPVSARHVADLAGVSRATVSRTFTPDASVSPEARAKVMAAADTLGYQVNHLARGLIRSETRLVALIAAEIKTPHRSDMLAALTDRLQQAGKLRWSSTPIAPMAMLNARSNRKWPTEPMRRSCSRACPPSLAETCLRYGMRLVLINRGEKRPGTLLIRLDDAAAGRQARCGRPAAGESR